MEVVHHSSERASHVLLPKLVLRSVEVAVPYILGSWCFSEVVPKLNCFALVAVGALVFLIRTSILDEDVPLLISMGAAKSLRCNSTSKEKWQSSVLSETLASHFARNVKAF